MQTSPPRALVVEDDRSWQQILSEILTDAGLAVDLAGNAPAAVACLRGAAHRLAVVDLSLGGADHRNQDGLAILDALRRHDPGCVAILLTGYATVELAVSALTEHGAFTCLRKEAFRRREFREIVRQALAEAPVGAKTGVQSSEISGQGSEVGDQKLAIDGRQSGYESRITNHEAGQAALPAGLVLVVEDDAGWRSILAELLGDAGYDVRAASSFGEALGYLRQETFRLAVVDLVLANSLSPKDNSDGLRLLSSTRQAGIPSVVVSGSALPEEIERAYGDYGIVAFLEKRAFDRQAFRRAVQLAERRAAQDGGSGELAELTEREWDVMALLVQGLTNKEIAEALVISENTVKRHLKSIFVKLDVNTRAAAVARAVSANRGVS